MTYVRCDLCVRSIRLQTQRCVARAIWTILDTTDTQRRHTHIHTHIII